MKRLIALIVLLVFGSVAYADYEMSDSQKQGYLDWLKTFGAWDAALAVAPNGCSYGDTGATPSQAKRAALKSCKKHCKSDACKVVDVNGTSAFIKQRGSSSSSSTASSSKNLIWCVTSSSYNNKYLHQVTRAGCAGMVGKAFVTQSLAEAEHKRLKGTATASSKKKVWCATKDAAWSSVKGCRSGVKAFSTESLAQAEHERLKRLSSSSSTASSSGYRIYCYDPSLKLFYASAKCADTDRTVSEQEYSQERLKGTTTASNGKTLQIRGRTYIGEVVNGQPHGQGTLTWPSGNNYVGGWKGGRRHGQGTFTTINGPIHIGVWKSDEPWEGIRYLASGEIAATYSNGKECYLCLPTERQLAIVRQINSGQIAPTPTPAQKPTLTIRSSPTDAKVYIGGAYKGTTELKVKLPLGNYSLRVEKSGYNNFNQQIELKESMVLWPSLSKKEKQKPEPKPQAPKLIGTGTGFLVNKDYVVTAEHVLEDCNVVRVRFGHKEIAAKTVTMDASSDLGLLRLGKSIASAEVSWVVRIGLFKRSANADKYEARLRQHGLDPQRESIMVDGQLATRLFLGPFPTIDKADKEQQSAEIAAKDLALKVTEKSATAKLRGGKPIRVGATVATYGYPLFGKLSDSAKITQGHINSLAGIDNDSSRFQYDAPTQFGNSGGPVLDAAGNVVGVVVSGLDDAKTQSINFAVKSNIVENFLSSNNVPYEKADSTEELKLPDIAEKAERFTVLVGCWK